MREDFSFPSHDGKTRIHAIRWTPEDGKYHAILQITHGMIEHIERYEPFALYLTRHGFMVVGHDHLGHGSSVRSKEDWGYFAPENAGEILIEDMHRLRVITQEENPDLPYFMMGHSMGSFLLRKYIVVHGKDQPGDPEQAAGRAEGRGRKNSGDRDVSGRTVAETAAGRLSGAIIMGSGYTKPRSSALGIMIATGFARVFGWRHRSPLVTFMAFRKNLHYDTTGKDPARNWLSRDPESVRRYYSDPRCTYLFTLNGYRTLFETVSFVCHQENVDLVPGDLPVLIISGEDDPVGEGGKGVRKLASMFWRAGVKDLKLKIYEGYRHEILNDYGKEQVYRDLLDWMEKRAADQ